MHIDLVTKYPVSLLLLNLANCHQSKDIYNNSGKASKDTLKSQIIILPDAKDIVDVIAGEPGLKSDTTKLVTEILGQFSKMSND